MTKSASVSKQVQGGAKTEAKLPFLDERALLEAVLAQDRGAMGELLRRYDATIKKRIGFLLSRYARAVNSSDTAEDIRAEFYLSLVQNDMRKLRSYDPERGSTLNAWLSLLAQNATIDHVRKLGRRDIMEPLDSFERDEQKDGQRGARWVAEGL